MRQSSACAQSTESVHAAISGGAWLQACGVLMGAVFSSLDACFERQDLAHESGVALETSPVTSERSKDVGAVYRQMGQRLQLIHCAMRVAAGKSSVGRSVRIASDTHTSDPSVRRFDGMTGTITEYDVATDTCTIDVGAAPSARPPRWTASVPSCSPSRLAFLSAINHTD